MIAVLLITNFIIAYKIFSLSEVFSCMTSLTAILTPSLYPTDTAIHISLLGRFHIINSVSTTAVIVIAAFTTNSFTQDNLVWTPLDRVGVNSSDIVRNISFSDNNVQFNITDSISCTPEPSTTPLLLTYGVLPPVLVASLVYVFIVVVIMGLVRPSFLELPPSHYSSRQDSLRKSPVIEITEKSVSVEVTEEQSLIDMDKRKSEIRFDVDYVEFLEGKETQL